MEGDSISGKVRTAIMTHELDREAQVLALKKQIDLLNEMIDTMRKDNHVRRTMQ